MTSTESGADAPEPTGNRRRVVAIAVGVAVVAAGLIFALASRGDDSDTSSGPANIDTPAVVTGLTAPESVTVPTSDIVVDSLVTSPEFTRDLLEAGQFDCANPGLWQPIDDLQLIVQVGEPPAGQACPDTVVALPAGWCSTAPCSQVPADWEIRLQPGTPTTELLLIVAPDSNDTAWFHCVRNLVPQPPQFLRREVTVEAACATLPIDSVDVPFVPTSDSIDIPFVPPSLSSDIPTG